MSRSDRAQALAREIRAYCQAHADAATAGKWARYFSEGYDAWGLLDKNDPLWGERQQAWLAAYADLRLAGWLELGEILLESGKYEEGALAIRFLKAHRDEFTARALPKLARWFAGIRNWAHTDVLCGELLAPMLAGGTLSLEALAGWRQSPHRFARRAVPVSMLGLLKAKPDVAPLVEFVRPLMTDPERVVHQGVGWFLREAWKQQPKPVEAFLLEWKDTAPRLIFQYATEKMTPAGKARFRAARKSR